MGELTRDEAPFISISMSEERESIDLRSGAWGCIPTRWRRLLDADVGGTAI